MYVCQSSLWARMLAALLCAGSLLFQSSFGRTPDGKEILAALSWGDQIGFLPGDKPLTAEKFLKQFPDYNELGVDTVLFRIDVLRWVRDYNWPEPRLNYKNAPPDIVSTTRNSGPAPARASRRTCLPASSRSRTGRG